MIIHTVQAIAWGHNMKGYESPTSSVWVREVVNGLKRKYSQVKKSKEPLSFEKLIEIVSICNKKKTDLRNTCCMVLGFFGFLRCEEILGIKRNHIVFHDTHLEILLPNSKTDKLRQGNRVLIAKLHENHCPVMLLQQFLLSSKSKESDDKFIFRRVITASSGQFLTLLNEPMKYGNLSDIISRKLEQVNLNPKLYGTHSLRAGGCSAVANKGIADRLFQKHGRWATSASKDSYVKDSISKLLLVTKSLKK
jgi:integrase